MAAKRINVYLICGGKYHDIDFARLELLKLLAEHSQMRVRVAENYSDRDAIAAADCLITYTCDIVPSEAEQETLRAFLQGGKRWFALHGTNSILRFLSMDPLMVGAPREAPLLMEMLGSQFIAHPPVGRFRVDVSDSEHPLVQGIEPFETEDELYLSEYHGENHSLLHCHYQGEAEGFQEHTWNSADPHLVFYLHPYDAGEVLYLTLGHCRGTYDMLPLMEAYPQVERCSWELPVYYELLRRGIGWAAEISPASPPASPPANPDTAN